MLINQDDGLCAGHLLLLHKKSLVFVKKLLFRFSGQDTQNDGERLEKQFKKHSRVRARACVCVCVCVCARARA